MKIEPIQNRSRESVHLNPYVAPEAPTSVVDRVNPVHDANKTEFRTDDREFTFDVDPEADQVVIRVYNPQTREQVATLPPETILKMAREIRQAQRKAAAARQAAKSAPKADSFVVTGS